MVNTKISALTALTGANLATDDAFAVVDTSVTTTKKITVAELKLGIMPAPGPIGATTPSTGAFTTLSAGGATLASNTFDFPTDDSDISWGTSGNRPIIRGNKAAQTLTTYTNGAVRTVVSNTGLAVTGTLSATNIVTPGTFTTGTRPAKTLGGIIFDTTLNKLLIGGVSAWEVVTSI